MKAFDSFLDLRTSIYDQMIRNKKRQKITAIIRKIKFTTLIGSPIWPEGMSPFSAKNKYFCIVDILNTPCFYRERFVQGFT